MVSIRLFLGIYDEYSFLITLSYLTEILAFEYELYLSNNLYKYNVRFITFSSLFIIIIIRMNVSELNDLIISYNSAVNNNEEAIKNLMEINSIIKAKNEIGIKEELERKIKLLNLRTKVINSQIQKKLKEFKH